MDDKLPFEPLAEKGFKLFFETDWVGEVGVDRHEVPTDRIRGLHLALTPAEWCAMCQSEGGEYVGGCCGNMGAVQDHINSIFREGGYVDGPDFSELGHLNETHESGEDHLFGSKHIGGTFAIKTRKDFDRMLAKWDKLGPWGKIGLAYAAVKDALPAGRDLRVVVHAEGRNPLEPKEAFHTVGKTCRYISYADVFHNAQEGSTQHGMDRTVTLARLLPAVRMVLKSIEADLQPVDGFAIVKGEAPNEVVVNGHGLCLYRSRDEAEKLIELLSKGVKEPPYVTIRPAKVTIEDGLVLG